MYPEKMTFSGFSFRTSRINELARMIYSLDEDYSENKNMTNGNNSSLSCQVVPVQFSNLFILDLKRLAGVVA
jgi:site-specific DNA recombinase